MDSLEMKNAEFSAKHSEEILEQFDFDELGQIVGGSGPDKPTQVGKTVGFGCCNNKEKEGELEDYTTIYRQY